jgi:hypothetical protein
MRAVGLAAAVEAHVHLKQRARGLGEAELWPASRRRSRLGPGASTTWLRLGPTSLNGSTWLRDPGPLHRRTSRAVGYEAPGAAERRSMSRRATSCSAVRRRFVAGTARALEQLMSGDLADLDVVVLKVDGVRFAEACCMVALAVTSDGTKVPVGCDWATPRTRRWSPTCWPTWSGGAWAPPEACRSSSTAPTLSPPACTRCSATPRSSSAASCTSAERG